MHQDFHAAEGDNFRLVVGAAKIGIARHDGDGRDELQLQWNHSVADIAGVEDVVDAGEDFFDARVEIAVSVRYDSDLHHYLSNSE